MIEAQNKLKMVSKKYNKFNLTFIPTPTFNLTFILTLIFNLTNNHPNLTFCRMILVITLKMSDRLLKISDWLFIRHRLKYNFPFQLDNQAFEELAADIFDEVDRRETEQGSQLFLY